MRLQKRLTPCLRLGLSLGLLTLGLGLGLSMAPCLVAAQTAVAPREVGVVTATVGLCRTLGGALGIAVLSSILFAVVGAASASGGGAALSALLADGARGAAPSPQLVQGFRLAFATASAMWSRITQSGRAAQMPMTKRSRIALPCWVCVTSGWNCTA